MAVARKARRPVFESFDGRHVYYGGPDRSIWKAPVAGGQATPVGKIGRRAAWTISASGIYVLDPDATGGAAVVLVEQLLDLGHLLSYQLAAGWTLGLGGASRSARFRLREHGPFPNGIGEERAIPLFGHVSGRFGRIFVLDVYAGALVGGELRVEDPGGNELHLRGYDPAPLLAAALSTRF